jgi:hypothetical protein
MLSSYWAGGNDRNRREAGRRGSRATTAPASWCRAGRVRRQARTKRRAARRRAHVGAALSPMPVMGRPDLPSRPLPTDRLAAAGAGRRPQAIAAGSAWFPCAAAGSTAAGGTVRYLPHTCRSEWPAAPAQLGGKGTSEAMRKLRYLRRCETITGKRVQHASPNK